MALCNFANTYLQNMAVAEDFVQEIFVHLWEKKDKIEIKTSLKSYLYQAVKHKCLNEIKHLKVREKHQTQVKEANAFDSSNEFDFEAEELGDIIQQKIDAMPEKRRDIFKLSREEGLSYKEIAEKLGVSIKTVENHMGLALKYLREELKHLMLFVIMILIKWYE